MVIKFINRIGRWFGLALLATVVMVTGACLPDPNPPSPVDNTIVRGTVIAKTLSVQPWGTYFYLGIDEWSTPDFGWVLVTEQEWHFCKVKPEQPNAWFRNDEQEFCEPGS